MVLFTLVIPPHPPREMVPTSRRLRFGRQSIENTAALVFLGVGNYVVTIICGLVVQEVAAPAILYLACGSFENSVLLKRLSLTLR